MKADPKYSAGARAERAAFRRYLRRFDPTDRRTVGDILAWVLARQQRYDRTAGGLGKR